MEHVKRIAGSGPRSGPGAFGDLVQLKAGVGKIDERTNKFVWVK